MNVFSFGNGVSVIPSDECPWETSLVALANASNVNIYGNRKVSFRYIGYKTNILLSDFKPVHKPLLMTLAELQDIQLLFSFQ